VALLGVAFRPYGAWIALGHPQQELAESVVPLAALLGDAVGDLRERLLDEPTPFGRVAIAERWLCQRAERGRSAHPLTRWAAQRIATSRGRVRVEELARESGFSRKHLSSLFRREVGLTPKALARVHRFHAAIGMLRRSRAVPWSELALECGYYDQSHLIRDFRLFAGCTPEELLRSPAPDELTLAFE
jgi:AraC-like DNA-binding protein